MESSCAISICEYNNIPRTLRRFLDMANYWSNFRCSEWTPKFRFAKVGLKKLKTAINHTVQSIFRYFERFRCDSRVWQTDRQTNTRTDFAIASAALHYVARPKSRTNWRRAPKSSDRNRFRQGFRTRRLFIGACGSHPVDVEVDTELLTFRTHQRFVSDRGRRHVVHNGRCFHFVALRTLRTLRNYE